jgi:hypothetical protein
MPHHKVIVTLVIRRSINAVPTAAAKKTTSGNSPNRFEYYGACPSIIYWFESPPDMTCHGVYTWAKVVSCDIIVAKPKTDFTKAGPENKCEPRLLLPVCQSLWIRCQYRQAQDDLNLTTC